MRSSFGILSFVALAGVAGCGGSGTSDVVDGPVIAPVVSQTAGSLGATIAHDETANTVTVQLGGLTAGTLAANSDLDDRTFSGYGISSGPRGNATIGFRAVTTSGGASVLVAAGTGVDELAVAEIARLAETTLPLTGSVRYLGEYMGIISEDSDERPVIAVIGDAMVTVDFAGGDVFGDITDREVVSRIDLSDDDDKSVTDITFNLGTLGDGGAFSGTTADATFTDTEDAQGGVYTGAGTYAGLITGDTGGEAVGAVQIEYDRVSGAPRSYTETGVFVLDEDLF